MYQSLARWCYGHRWTVVGVWLAIIVGLNAAGGAVGAAFNGEFTSTGSESDRGFEILEEYFPGAGSAFGGQIVFQRDAGVTGEEIAGPMSELFAEVDELDGVTIDCFESEGWWANVRKSNTEPLLRLNLEARDRATLDRMLESITPLLGEPAREH